jgi:mRNA-degrading endonuclease RelE of RelBE toxin-antitoxin system
MRVGDYRVVYGIDQEHRQITVYTVGHRREIYKLR